MPEAQPPFLGLVPGESGRTPARCRILPVAYDATVSYEGGAGEGPRAILAASSHVELYDQAFGKDAYADYGVETLDPFLDFGETAEDFVGRLAEHTAERFDPERLIVGLGGEHTVTAGLARGTARALGKPITLVQVDAHSDLRDEFHSDPYSHACVARRLLEDGVDQVVQLGIRAVSLEEAEMIDSDPRVHVCWADEIHEDAAGNHLRNLAEQVRERDVYLTIDVDGLDPSIIPATGTPEPNGLTWRQVLQIIRTTAQAARVVGLDVVELAPRPGLHASDFTAAKLTYHAVNVVAASRGWLT